MTYPTTDTMPIPASQGKTDLLAHAAILQSRHETAVAEDERRNRGQVFTPTPVARFMAGLFTRLPESPVILDAGAGVGTLAAAVCDRILAIESPRTVAFHLFENDPSVVPLLRENMDHCRAALEAAGHRLEVVIHQADFVLDTLGKRRQPALFPDGDGPDEFDAVIMNPPYFKIAAEGAYARAMNDAFRGQPNIYTLFLARAAEWLKPGGEMVAITPRSFCNGLYFRDFRRWFFARMALDHVHLFECRRSTFDNILQESVITHTHRLGTPARSTTITSSFGREIPDTLPTLSVPTETVLDDSSRDMVVRIPTSAEELAILEAVESWPRRFGESDLRISTGPVVMFRTERFHLSEPNGETWAPLLGPHNVRAFRTAWPVQKRGWPLAFHVCHESRKHVVPSQTYVLLRRFSAKEERRRLTASMYQPSSDAPPYLALENHLNYVYHARRELTHEEASGIAAVFNSALLDRYFRILSGNTQVNATEIRTIPFPDLHRLARIGSRLLVLGDFAPEDSERIVLEELEINGTLAAYLREAAV